ncbi:hypothetical protein FPQ18DRAFT_418233 [Pyronema domesticum]|nr:hypothetical protein FPQ18DRAFT_418233 [Pyronema domesticum]
MCRCIGICWGPNCSCQNGFQACTADCGCQDEFCENRFKTVDIRHENPDGSKPSSMCDTFYCLCRKSRVACNAACEHQMHKCVNDSPTPIPKEYLPAARNIKVLPVAPMAPMAKVLPVASMAPMATVLPVAPMAPMMGASTGNGSLDSKAEMNSHGDGKGSRRSGNSASPNNQSSKNTIVFTLPKKAFPIKRTAKTTSDNTKIKQEPLEDNHTKIKQEPLTDNHPGKIPSTHQPSSDSDDSDDSFNINIGEGFSSDEDVKPKIKRKLVELEKRPAKVAKNHNTDCVATQRTADERTFRDINVTTAIPEAILTPAAVSTHPDVSPPTKPTIDPSVIIAKQRPKPAAIIKSSTARTTEMKFQLPPKPVIATKESEPSVYKEIDAASIKNRDLSKPPSSMATANLYQTTSQAEPVHCSIASAAIPPTSNITGDEDLLDIPMDIDTSDMSDYDDPIISSTMGKLYIMNTISTRLLLTSAETASHDAGANSSNDSEEKFPDDTPVTNFPRRTRSGFVDYSDTSSNVDGPSSFLLALEARLAAAKRGADSGVAVATDSTALNAAKGPLAEGRAKVSITIVPKKKMPSHRGFRI